MTPPSIPPEDPDEIRLPRHSVWRMLPPRTFVRVFTLLGLLALILLLRARAARLADQAGRILYPEAASQPSPQPGSK